MQVKLTIYTSNMVQTAIEGDAIVKRQLCKCGGDDASLDVIMQMPKTPAKRR
jgi:hypothetical protein